jgi:DNA-binding response OmpR family regulator
MNAHLNEQPTVFLIEEDDDTRPLLKHNLISYGYHVSLALDEEDARERVSDGQLNADLILINVVSKTTEEVLNIGRRIRAHAKFDGVTPLIVMAEKYGKDVEGTDENVGGNDWILYLGEDLNQLQNLLYRLLTRP